MCGGRGCRNVGKNLNGTFKGVLSANFLLTAWRTRCVMQTSRKYVSVLFLQTKNLINSSRAKNSFLFFATIVLLHLNENCQATEEATRPSEKTSNYINTKFSFFWFLFWGPFRPWWIHADSLDRSGSKSGNQCCGPVTFWYRSGSVPLSNGSGSGWPKTHGFYEPVSGYGSGTLVKS